MNVCINKFEVSEGSLICSHVIECKVNYHQNFRVAERQWIYYQEIPDVLQIEEHQFAEVHLINMWISMKLFSWTSATNCAQIYNETSQQLQSGSPPVSWPFNLSVTSSQVYDAFTLLSLLEDCKSQKSTLVVPHKGTLGGMNRFAEAVHSRNVRLQLCNKPELFHYCKKCVRFYTGMYLFTKQNLINI